MERPAGSARRDTDATTQVSGVRSRAAIGGHPLHPMVIPLPIGLNGCRFTTPVDVGFPGVAVERGQD